MKDATEETPEPSQYFVFSATQVDTFLSCRRKWAWGRIAKIEVPQGPSAQVGDRVHKQLEGYLQGQPLDFTEVVNGVSIGDIAASGVHLLPEPNAPGMQIETSFRFQAPSTGFVYVGRKDVEIDDSGIIPGLVEETGIQDDGEGATGVPAVLDHKTTSGLRWAKDREALLWDVQANLYAYALMVERKVTTVDLVWNYYQTRNAKGAKRTHLRVHSDHAARAFGLIQDVAKEMAAAHVASKQAGDVHDFIRTLPPNTETCGAYGGCPFEHVCQLTPEERMRSLMSTGDDFLDSLKKRAKAQDVASKPAAVSVAQEPEPALPAWATEPVDPLTLRKNKPALPPAGPAINPPESKVEAPVALPPEPAPAPAPVAEVKVESAPAEPSQSAQPEEPKKRGRPKGSKNAAKDETPSAPPVINVAHLYPEPFPVETSATVTVTWAEESYTPVPYNTFRVGPFSITGCVLAGETVQDACVRLYTELDEFASKVRTSKAASFAAVVGECK